LRQLANAKSDSENMTLDELQQRTAAIEPDARAGAGSWLARRAAQLEAHVLGNSARSGRCWPASKSFSAVSTVASDLTTGAGRVTVAIESIMIAHAAESKA